MMYHMWRSTLLALAFLVLRVAIYSQAPSGELSAEPVPANPQTEDLPITSPLEGVWVNSSRFVEFARDGRLRIVLKPYYAFVYEETGWISYSLSPLGFGSTESEASGVSAYRLSLRYTGEKVDATVPLAVIGDDLYFRFYRKASLSPTGADAPASGTARPLNGFWIAAGNSSALRLYRSEPVQEFYCFYFTDDAYYRIRYWAADVRVKDVAARFTTKDGRLLTVPKFIPIDGVIYTCITSTGKELRNYESGTYAFAGGALSFKPDAVVFSGTAAAIRKPLKVTLSPDGSILALGSPYLVRSKVTDLTAEIKAHNALRRPPRKPIFEFMKLDFHWDEIARIRNNGKDPEKTGK
jgi:hypothetical protein